MSQRSEHREFLLDAVEAVRDTVSAGVAEGEAIGTLPKATVDALSSSGLARFKAPAALGGLEADPITQLEVLESLARVDGSTGWCLMIQGGSSGLVGGFLSDDAAAQVFDGSIPYVAGQVAPRGQALPVSGGFEVSGRWQFGSGIRHAEWVLAGVRVGRSDTAPDVRIVVVPRSQVEIHDNWQVSGFKGTGSCDYTIDSVFVPEAFAFAVSDLESGNPLRGGPMYRMGFPGFVTTEHTGVALGIGRRALDEITEQAGSKLRGLEPAAASSVALRASFQKDLGRAEMLLNAARSLAFATIEHAWDVACSGRVPEAALQAELRSVAVYATEAAAEVTMVAYRYAGGGVLYDTNPIQRCFRDINAASQHFVVSDTSFEALAQFRLGLSDPNPLG